VPVSISKTANGTGSEDESPQYDYRKALDHQISVKQRRPHGINR
jgi:hypothetical protein